MPIERGIAGLSKFGRRSASFFSLDSQNADSTYTDSADSSRTVYQYTTDGSISITITEDTCVHTKTSRDLRFRGFRGVDPGSFIGGVTSMDYLMAGGGAGGGPGVQNLGGGGGGGGAVKGYWPTVYPSGLQEPGNIQIGTAGAQRFASGDTETPVSVTVDVGAAGGSSTNGSDSSITFPTPAKTKFGMSDVTAQGGGYGGTNNSNNAQSRPEASGGGAGGNSSYTGGTGGPKGNNGGNSLPTNGYHDNSGGAGAGGGGMTGAGSNTGPTSGGSGGNGQAITIPTRPGSTTFGLSGGGGGAGRPGINGPTHGNRWPSRSNGGAGPNGGGAGNSNAPSSNNYGGGGGGGSDTSGKDGANGIVLVVF